LEWAVALAVVVWLVARFGSARRLSAPTGVKAIAILSTLQIGALLLLFSTNDAVEARYLYPMLVLLAVILMSVCAPIESRTVLASLFLVCALQFAVVHRVALGFAAPLANQFTYLRGPQDDWTQYREVERLVRMTSVAAGRYNIVGVENLWLNSNTASFFAAKNRLGTGVRSYYTSLGYAQKDITAAVERVEALNTMYYITFDERFQSSAPDFLNQASLPMLRYVSTAPRFVQSAASDASGVVIFRRHSER
jgi:hypothetical protein